ncbi:MAG: hypothetical protein RPU34_04375 [Candidatus Sedimenticola sp. (ex Thyasira tokunagai)]
MKGQSPGADLLRALVRTERVSMRWLDDERGAPYHVSRVVDDKEATALLEGLLDDEDWSVLLATDDDQRFCVILHQPGSYTHKDKPIKYEIVEVVSGGITLDTVRWLDERDRGLWKLPLIPEQFERLATGHMGNMEIFGWDDPRKQSAGLKGLRCKMESTVHDSPLRERLERNGELMCEEEGAAYAFVTKTEEMARRFEQLPADQQDLVLDLMQAMVEKKQHQTDTH